MIEFWGKFNILFLYMWQSVDSVKTNSETSYENEKGSILWESQKQRVALAIDMFKKWQIDNIEPLKALEKCWGDNDKELLNITWEFDNSEIKIINNSKSQLEALIVEMKKYISNDSWENSDAKATLVALEKKHLERFVWLNDKTEKVATNSLEGKKVTQEQLEQRLQYVGDIVDSLSPDEVINYVAEINKEIDTNNWQSDNTKALYKNFSVTLNNLVLKKIASVKIEKTNDWKSSPEETKNKERILRFVKIITWREGDIDNDLRDPDTAWEALRFVANNYWIFDSMDINKVGSIMKIEDPENSPDKVTEVMSKYSKNSNMCTFLEKIGYEDIIWLDYNKASLEQKWKMMTLARVDKILIAKWKNIDDISFWVTGDVEKDNPLMTIISLIQQEWTKLWPILAKSFNDWISNVLEKYDAKDLWLSGIDCQIVDMYKDIQWYGWWWFTIPLLKIKVFDSNTSDKESMNIGSFVKVGAVIVSAVVTATIVTIVAEAGTFWAATPWVIAMRGAVASWIVATWTSVAVNQRSFDTFWSWALDITTELALNVTLAKFWWKFTTSAIKSWVINNLVTSWVRRELAEWVVVTALTKTWWTLTKEAMTEITEQIFKTTGTKLSQETIKSITNFAMLKVPPTLLADFGLWMWWEWARQKYILWNENVDFLEMIENGWIVMAMNIAVWWTSMVSAYKVKKINKEWYFTWELDWKVISDDQKLANINWAIESFKWIDPSMFDKIPWLKWQKSQYDNAIKYLEWKKLEIEQKQKHEVEEVNVVLKNNRKNAKILAKEKNINEKVEWITKMIDDMETKAPLKYNQSKQEFSDINKSIDDAMNTNVEISSLMSKRNEIKQEIEKSWVNDKWQNVISKTSNDLKKELEEVNTKLKTLIEWDTNIQQLISRRDLKLSEMKDMEWLHNVKAWLELKQELINELKKKKSELENNKLSISEKSKLKQEIKQLEEDVWLISKFRKFFVKASITQIPFVAWATILLVSNIVKAWNPFDSSWRDKKESDNIETLVDVDAIKKAQGEDNDLKNNSSGDENSDTYDYEQLLADNTDENDTEDIVDDNSDSKTNSKNSNSTISNDKTTTENEEELVWLNETQKKVYNELSSDMKESYNNLSESDKNKCKEFMNIPFIWKFIVNLYIIFKWFWWMFGLVKTETSSWEDKKREAIWTILNDTNWIYNNEIFTKKTSEALEGLASSDSTKDTKISLFVLKIHTILWIEDETNYWDKTKTKTMELQRTIWFEDKDVTWLFDKNTAILYQNFLNTPIEQRITLNKTFVKNVQDLLIAKWKLTSYEKDSNWNLIYGSLTKNAVKSVLWKEYIIETDLEKLK